MVVVPSEPIHILFYVCVCVVFVDAVVVVVGFCFQTPIPNGTLTESVSVSTIIILSVHTDTTELNPILNLFAYRPNTLPL